MLYDADQAERMRMSCRMLQVECHFRESDLKGEHVTKSQPACRLTDTCQGLPGVLGRRGDRLGCLSQQREGALTHCLPLGLQGSQQLPTAHCTGHSPAPASVQSRASSGAMPSGLPPGLAAMLLQCQPSTMGWVTMHTRSDVHPCSSGFGTSGASSGLACCREPASCSCLQVLPDVAASRTRQHSLALCHRVVPSEARAVTHIGTCRAASHSTSDTSLLGWLLLRATCITLTLQVAGRAWMNTAPDPMVGLAEAMAMLEDFEVCPQLLPRRDVRLAFAAAVACTPGTCGVGLASDCPASAACGMHLWHVCRQKGLTRFALNKRRKGIAVVQ